MLKLFYGREYKSPFMGMKIILFPNKYFNYEYEPEWLDDEFSKKVIKEIDKSEVLGNRVINSPFLGLIPPEKLSAGTKTLILMKFTNNLILNGSECGDNCAPFILEVAKDKDVVLNMRHFMDFGDGPFEIQILNDGRITRNRKEYLDGMTYSHEEWEKYYEENIGQLYPDEDSSDEFDEELVKLVENLIEEINSKNK